MAKESVLLIEDDRDLSELMKYNLEREGYRVLQAFTGEDGFETVKRERPDAIILDVMLPNIDGFELCRLFKVTEATRDIPVIIVTAKSADVDQVVGLELGASDYLTKPFSVRILLARLKNVLKRREAATESSRILRCCEVTLNMDRQKVAVDGKEEPLTKMEMNVLELLMRRPSVVVTRERLVEAVWGRGACVSDAAVNMQIKSLRRKLGKGRGHIGTVRGTGFRFC